MINKIVRMLNQEQGFTLMELMIVVVIIGILAGVAVPVYNGVQNRAKYAVGEANANILNRGVRQLEALGYYGKLGDSEEEEEKEHKVSGEDGKYSQGKDEKLLLTFLGFEDGDVIQYVKWETSEYKSNIESQIEVEY